MRVPGGTVTLWPSIVTVTSGKRCHRPDVALMPERVVLVLAAEVTNRGVDHPARRVSEATQAAAVLERIGNALKDVELDLRTLVGEDALVCAHGPIAADAARRAFATRLMGVELQQPVSG